LSAGKKSKALFLTLESYLGSVYAETVVHRGLLLNYIGMSFDFTTAGEVSLIIANFVDEILRS
jgi:hypothetical protein